MKNYIKIFSVMAVTAIVFSACGGSGDKTQAIEEEGMNLMATQDVNSTTLPLSDSVEIETDFMLTPSDTVYNTTKDITLTLHKFTGFDVTTQPILNKALNTVTYNYVVTNDSVTIEGAGQSFTADNSVSPPSFSTDGFTGDINVFVFITSSANATEGVKLKTKVKHKTAR